MDPHREMLRDLVHETVENQIRDNDPPAARETLERLIAEGIPKEKAIDLIGCVVVNEMFETLKHGRVFDLEQYVAALRRLPQLPWE